MAEGSQRFVDWSRARIEFIESFVGDPSSIPPDLDVIVFASDNQERMDVESQAYGSADILIACMGALSMVKMGKKERGIAMYVAANRGLTINERSRDVVIVIRETLAAEGFTDAEMLEEVGNIGEYSYVCLRIAWSA